MKREHQTGIPLKGNPNVDHDLLERVRQIQEGLERHGLKKEGTYRIQPALGGTISDRFAREDRRRSRGTSAWSSIAEEAE